MDGTRSALLRIDEAHNRALCGQLEWHGIRLRFASRRLAGAQLHIRIEMGDTRLLATVDPAAGWLRAAEHGDRLGPTERDALRALAAAISDIIDLDGSPLRPGGSLAFAATMWADEPAGRGERRREEAVLV